jgi:hypothetical protein
MHDHEIKIDEVSGESNAWKKWDNLKNVKSEILKRKEII